MRRPEVLQGDVLCELISAWILVYTIQACKLMNHRMGNMDVITRRVINALHIPAIANQWTTGCKYALHQGHILHACLLHSEHAAAVSMRVKNNCIQSFLRNYKCRGWRESAPIEVPAPFLRSRCCVFCTCAGSAPCFSAAVAGLWVGNMAVMRLLPHGAVSLSLKEPRHPCCACCAFFSAAFCALPAAFCDFTSAACFFPAFLQSHTIGLQPER